MFTPFPVQKTAQILVWFILAGAAILGTAVHKDYGISWDEETNKNVMLLAEKYAFKGDQELLSTPDRFYGTAFESVLLLAERMFKPGQPIQNVYFLRHLINFYFFLLGVFFFYLLARLKFASNEAMGLLAVAFLILSPRQFADAFYNAKDIPFLSAFIISMYTLALYLHRKTPLAAAAHACSCAFLMGIRIVGVAVPVLTFIFVVLDAAWDEFWRENRLHVFLSFFLYAACLAPLTILFWPFLWEHPVSKFYEAYQAMSHYNWGGTVLYLGEFIKADRLPWHYIPVWMLVTVPLLYTVFFLTSIFKIARSLMFCIASFYTEHKLDLICLCWLAMPIAAVIFKKSVLYDGWRQMYFLYPAFLMLALEGIYSSFKWVGGTLRGSKRTGMLFLLILAICLNSAFLTLKMIELHPYQNIYFNRLAGKSLKEIKNKFELDYWGLSFRKALEFIVRHDTRKTIKVYPSNLAGDHNALILDPADQKRLVFLRDIEGADYFITNYRWHPADYEFTDELFSVTRDGAKIVSVFKLK